MLCIIKETMSLIAPLRAFSLLVQVGIRYLRLETNATFRLACRSPHCRFDGDFCSTAQAPLAAEERPSSGQRQANQSITSPLCPQRQTVDFYSTWTAMSLGGKAKAAWPIRAATLKRQAVIRRCSSNVVSGKLV